MSPSTRLSSRCREQTQPMASRKRRAFKDLSNNAERSNNGGSSKRLRVAAVKCIQQRHRPSEVDGAAEKIKSTRPPQQHHKETRRSKRLLRSNSCSDNDSGSSYNDLAAYSSSPQNRLIGNEYQYRGTVDFMDERDAGEPICAMPYVKVMYEHFREKEKTSRPSAFYLDVQPELSDIMRAILVDWLAEVHLKFRLVPETLYLTINIVDRYLSRATVSKKNLQLIGVTSLMIAAKYEEIYPMGLDDLVYICDSAYNRSDLLKMEYKILRELKYNITIPTAHSFLVRFLKAAHADKRLVQLSCMILDNCLLSYNLLQYLPSQLAAAAIAIARHSVGRNIWSPTLLRYAYYNQEEIVPIARAVLVEKNQIPSELKSIDKKYSSPRYGSVAETPLISLDE